MSAYEQHDALTNRPGLAASLDRIEKHALMLREELDRADERLGLILTPSQPRANSDDVLAIAPTAQSPLVSRAEKLADLLADAYRRLAGLLDRVEL